MTQTFGIFPVSGVSLNVVSFRTDKRVGRVDFQIRNLGTEDIVLNAQEATASGAFATVLGAPVTIKGGGVGTISLSSAKSRVRIISDATNAGNGSVQIQAMYFGNTFGGNLSVDDNLPRTAWTGADVPLGEG